MNYKQTHFQKCRVNPLEPKFLDKAPALKEVSDDDRMWKYIIGMYDPQSPMVHQFRDVRMRKSAAAQFAGYDLQKDETMLSDLFALKEENIRKAVVYFVKEIGFPREWFIIVANEQTFYEYGERLMEPIKKDTESKEKDEMIAIEKKSKLSADMEVISERIDRTYRKMFGNDEDIDLPELTKRTTAEAMAGRI